MKHRINWDTVDAWGPGVLIILLVLLLLLLVCAVVYIGVEVVNGPVRKYQDGQVTCYSTDHGFWCTEKK